MCSLDEDHHHIIQCQSVVATNLWHNSMEEINMQLTQLEAPTETIQTILTLLHNYRNNTNNPIESVNASLAQAVAKQQALKVNCFMEGIPVKE